MTETITSLPPPVLYKFNRNLLTCPIIGFKLEELKEIYDFILNSITKRKYSRYRATFLKILMKLDEFLELYEQASKKEKQTENLNKTSELFYRPRLSNKNDSRVYERLRKKSSFSSKFRKNNTIYKV